MLKSIWVDIQVFLNLIHFMEIKYLKGGHDENGTVINTTEIIHANGTVENGTDLPKARDAHCMVLLPPGTKVIPINILAHCNQQPIPEL